MAWIRRRPAGYLVCWREDGRERSALRKTESEAEALKAELDRQAATRKVLAGVPGIPGWDGGETLVGESADPRFAFETYLKDFIENDRSLRETTRETYTIGLRTHIEGTPLGRADVRVIEPGDIQHFWDGLEVGKGALRNVQQLLSKGFNRAVKAGLIDVSPLRRTDVRRPSKQRAVDVIPLTVPEIERLASSTTKDRDRVAVLLMAYSALRAGEVGGLRVQDVDAGRSQLRLRQQVVRTHKEKTVTDLKTEAARRTVPVPTSLLEELRAFYESEDPADDGRIFHGPNGELWAHNAINTMVKKAASRAGIRGDVHSHVLRHTAVSLWIDDGANPKAIQTAVGHSDIQTTLQTYGHLFDYGGGALAASMERRREKHRNGT